MATFGGFFFGFFGFDFPAEFFFFGFFGFAAFVFFAFDFFDRDRVVFGFAVIRFGFVLRLGDDRGARDGHGQGHGVRRGSRGEQHQRGEQEGQQDRELAHGPFIGAKRGSA